jgi:phage head maturation protease
MPKIKPNENKPDYIARFMSDPTMVSDYPDTSQRMAIAEQQWTNTHKKSFVSTYTNKDDIGGRVIDFDDTKGVVKTYINAFNIKDLQNDISLPGSFTKTFKENFKNIFWHENHDDNTMPGITLELNEDMTGAIAIGQFNLQKQSSRDLYEDYKLFAKNGRSLQHSVRVRPIKYEIMPDPMDQDEEIRKVSEWQMREWSSLTKQGACPQTDVLSLKSESEIMEEINFLKEGLKLKYSDERLQNIEQQISELTTLIKEAGLSTSKNEPSQGIDYKYLINEIKNLKI